jgi:hypothetical protein
MKKFMVSGAEIAAARRAGMSHDAETRPVPSEY